MSVDPGMRGLLISLQHLELVAVGAVSTVLTTPLLATGMMFCLQARSIFEDSIKGGDGDSRGIAVCIHGYCGGKCGRLEDVEDVTSGDR